MSPRDHALELLALGTPQTQVAAAIGVGDSYITKLMNDEGFRLQLQERKAAATQGDLEFDKKLEDAELMALERVEMRLPTANFQQALAAFRILNSAKKRKEVGVPDLNAASGNRIVNIILPTVVLPNYVVNRQNEIVEVEGITMASASAQQLESVAAARGVVDKRAIEDSKPLYTNQKTIRTAQQLEGLAIRKLTSRSIKTIPDDMLLDII